MTETKQCQYVKADGQCCRAKPLPGKAVCLFHDPERAKQAQAARRRGGINRSKPRAVLPADTPDLPLASFADVCQLLGETINQVRIGRLDVKVGHTVGFLAGVLLKAIEASELERMAEEIDKLKALVPNAAQERHGVRAWADSAAVGPGAPLGTEGSADAEQTGDSYRDYQDESAGGTGGDAGGTGGDLDGCGEGAGLLAG
jgi:hypothetical protein